jgi:sec-independent protein translocase protein TatA
MPNWIGGPEMLIALVVILLLFGAKKIPELARGLGSGVREFKAGAKEDPKVREEKKNEELPEGEDESAPKAEANGDETRLDDDASAEADKAEQKQA